MAKQIKSGFLNQRITIFKHEDVDDGAGGSIPNEVSYWETSATVTMLKSSRNLQANQEELKPAVMFEVRFRDDKFVNVDLQIKWRDQLFTIQSAEPDYVYKTNMVIIARAKELPKQ